MNNASKYSEGARQALNQFQNVKGSSGDTQSDIRDLLTEIFHLTAEEGMDITFILNGATDTFEEEVEERMENEGLNDSS